VDIVGIEPEHVPPDRDGGIDVPLDEMAVCDIVPRRRIVRQLLQEPLLGRARLLVAATCQMRACLLVEKRQGETVLLRQTQVLQDLR
jgi:hypothetical protein